MLITADKVSVEVKTLFLCVYVGGLSGGGRGVGGGRESEVDCD